jgi:hypothetical protein
MIEIAASAYRPPRNDSEEGFMNYDLLFFRVFCVILRRCSGRRLRSSAVNKKPCGFVVNEILLQWLPVLDRELLLRCEYFFYWN